MTIDHKSALFFNPPILAEMTIETQIKLLIPYSEIYVEINPKLNRNYGLTAGSEGLGCEFFTDDNENLYAMLLDLKPYNIVNTPPMELLNAIRDRITTLSETGFVSLKTFPRSPIHPDTIWFFEPFGTSIFSFDQVIISPIECFMKYSEQMQFVKIGQGVTLGLEHHTNALQMVMVEGFDKEQELFGVSVSEDSHGNLFMENLNHIHFKYYQDPDYFRSNLVPQFSEEEDENLVSQIVSFYRKNLGINIMEM